MTQTTLLQPSQYDDKRHTSRKVSFQCYLASTLTRVVVVIYGVAWGARPVLRSTRIRARSAWPFSDAKCSAVHPSFSWADTSAPRSLTICARSTWPFFDAKCSAVHPSFSCAD